MSFQDKVVFISGSASGIGETLALKFAEEGADLFLVDVQEYALHQQQEMLQKRGYQVAAYVLDVRDEDAVKEVFQKARSNFDRLDIAINNAGIEGAPVRTADTSLNDFENIMQVNVRGLWLCLREEIKWMLESGSGSIINMASVAGLVGAHSLPIYSASKHAVVGLTKSAALEYAKKKVRINAICPAVIDTPMFHRSAEMNPELAQAVTALNPSRRLGTREEVAEAALWLASEKSSFTTGASLRVDGGFTAA
jgi:NAD(P)-dependent dehydrogenase (short-subunit alcohol dehydrogenase family)